MKELKKKLKKDWGSRCKDFSPLCGNCLAWQAYQTLEGLYSAKYHLTKWKVKKLLNGKNI